MVIRRKNGSRTRHLGSIATPTLRAMLDVIGHLPPHLAEVSKPFADLARTVVDALPRNPERTVALRKLLEAKDAAVRAMVAKD